MLNEYCVDVIGIKGESIPSSGHIITHNKIKYELLIDINPTRLISGDIDVCF